MGIIYSMLVPAHGGEDVFFKVDHERITMETVMDMYAPSSHFNPGSGKKGYEIVHGMHPPLIINPDTSRITRLYEELREQLEFVLDMTGDAGKKVKEKFAKDFPFIDLINALTERRFRASEEHLRSVMYTLISLFSELLQSLNQAENNASGFQISAEKTLALVEETPELIRKEYAEWVEAAQNLIIAKDELKLKEDNAKVGIDMMEELHRCSRLLLADSDGEISEVRAYLDGGEEGFRRCAHRFVFAPGIDRSVLKDTMVEMVDTAKMYVGVCREKEEKERQKIRSLRADQQPRWEKDRSDVEDLMKKFRECTTTFKSYSDKYRKLNKENEKKGKSLLPYPHELGSESLISKEEYEQAEAISQDSEWGPQTAEMRIKNKIQKCVDLLQKEPSLSGDTKDLFTLVEKDIDNVTEELVCLANEGGDTVPSPSSRGRLVELYELVVCAGYELSRGEKFFTTTSVNSILETILYLSEKLPEEYRFTEEEISEYKAEISELIRDEKEFIKRETGESTDVICERLEKTQCRWISYNTPKNLGGIKLAKNSWGFAQSLMEGKFKIAPQDIRSAYDAKRVDQRERAKKRKDDKAQ